MVGLAAVLMACTGAPTEVAEPRPEDPAVEVAPDPETPPETPPEVTEEPTCHDEPMEIWCGHGQGTFIAIMDGTQVSMEAGPQGWHIWTSMIVRNTEQLVRLSVDLVDVESGERVASGVLNKSLEPLAGGSWECEGLMVGWQSFLDLGEAPTVAARGVEPVALCGKELEMTIRLSDPFEGTLLGEGTARFIAQPDPVQDGPPCEVTP